MNKLLAALLVLFVFTSGTAQIVKPVKWTSKTEKISDTEFNLIMQGKIDDEWHVYSQYTPDGGPLPAEFKFENAKGNYELIGKPKESAYKKAFNDIFEVDEYFFEKQVTFTQRIKLINTKLTSIKGKIDYQVCKTACINDKQDFVFEIPASAAPAVQPTVTDTVAVVAADTLTTVAKSDTPTVAVETPKQEDKKGLWTMFFLAFLVN